MKPQTKYTKANLNADLAAARNTVTYTNKALGETYKLAGVKDLAAAWNLAAFVCGRNGWNLSMFTTDVRVSLSTKN